MILEETIGVVTILTLTQIALKIRLDEFGILHTNVENLKSKIFGDGHIGYGEMLFGYEVNAVAFLELVVK